MTSLQTSSMLSDSNSLAALVRMLEVEAQRRIDTNRLKHYKPYAKQRDFHAAGATHSERLFMAGNQLGKTIAGGAEWAMHLTGRYPDWWQGATFDKPPILWASGVTGESTRDNPQRVLIGPPTREEDWGTGMIPKDALADWNRAMGIPNLMDNATVRWGGGGSTTEYSTVSFKAYEKGRAKWQGPTIDGVWFDEERPLEIYTEGLTRTNNGQRGQFSIMITFTPLLGMSDVVSLFLLDEKRD